MAGRTDGNLAQQSSEREQFHRQTWTSGVIPVYVLKKKRREDGRMRKYLNLFGLVTVVLILGGCAAGIQISTPIPAMEQVQAMTAYLMSELALPPEMRPQVRTVVEANAEVKKNAYRMAREGRRDINDMEDSRFRRFEREMAPLLQTKEQKKHLHKIASQLKKRESAKRWKNKNLMLMPDIGDLED